jgi:hypothetical protein
MYAEYDSNVIDEARMRIWKAFRSKNWIRLSNDIKPKRAGRRDTGAGYQAIRASACRPR